MQAGYSGTPLAKKLEIASLGEVQETMMIPLLGRALETKKRYSILNDPKSVEIVESLNYDFSRFADKDSLRSMMRTTVRTAIIDQVVKGFIQKNPDATIVELGCGLNTRFERTDNGRIKWFDLDMPDSYEVWKNFFSESERRKYLACSAFDMDWMVKVVDTNPSAVLFISEASIIYFPEEMVRQLFFGLCKHFPGQHYLFDSASKEFVKNLAANDALKFLSARMKWGMDNIKGLEQWEPSIKVLKTIDLEDPFGPYYHLYPTKFLVKSFFEKLRGSLKKRQYQMNLVRL